MESGRFGKGSSKSTESETVKSDFNGNVTVGTSASLCQASAAALVTVCKDMPSEVLVVCALHTPGYCCKYCNSSYKYRESQRSLTPDKQTWLYALLYEHQTQTTVSQGTAQGRLRHETVRLAIAILRAIISAAGQRFVPFCRCFPCAIAAAASTATEAAVAQ
eukprot:10170-Heterococcus_DN1.PRE.2